MRRSPILIVMIALTATQAVYASTENARHELTADTDVRKTISQPVTTDASEPHLIADVSDGQVGTGTSQAPSRPPRHKHHLRNALIAFGACFALALVIAVAAK